ncbi:hypothetical protein IMZ31_24250 (plasmid) [Pontibacillus sp. ALD_SL1]|uniref:hypothetical protein n=1 Tax=Pontibacillus sp. ALD_SL1 TaxID=2777185 RepID=UPI001A9661D7|nr:hypothetical protein [Pontibacillus sp. ALD_SL1]QST02565.1 hypothetical protein IMZ31_24250 [Pontibacillus sp. ALD_SL1]
MWRDDEDYEYMNDYDLEEKRWSDDLDERARADEEAERREEEAREEERRYHEDQEAFWEEMRQDAERRDEEREEVRERDREWYEEKEREDELYYEDRNYRTPPVTFGGSSVARPQASYTRTRPYVQPVKKSNVPFLSRIGLLIVAIFAVAEYELVGDMLGQYGIVATELPRFFLPFDPYTTSSLYEKVVLMLWTAFYVTIFSLPFAAISMRKTLTRYGVLAVLIGTGFLIFGVATNPESSVYQASLLFFVAMILYRIVYRMISSSFRIGLVMLGISTLGFFLSGNDLIYPWYFLTIASSFHLLAEKINP